MDTRTTRLNPITEAIWWLRDCFGPEIYLTNLTDEVVKRAIERHFVGGWAAFVKDDR